MRSAWSPTRSMSWDTFFEVSPNRLLALPTVLATDLTSRSGRPAFLIAARNRHTEDLLGPGEALERKPAGDPSRSGAYGKGRSAGLAGGALEGGPTTPYRSGW